MNIVVNMIKLYQNMPLSSHNKCRFIPTCSNYMIDAINEYGTLKGVNMGIKRILKCHPFGPKGFDPVPKKENNK